MRFTSLAPFAAFAMGMLSPAPAMAQEPEGDFVCGNYEEAAALAKSADLPRITKFWNGKLKALVVRVAFSDAAYTVTDSTINKTNNAINTLYRSMSRNAFEWDWKIHPIVLKAPGTKAGYGADYRSLQTWISAQLVEAGLKRGTDYDVYVANFPNINVGWAGLSNLRDWDLINGSYSSGVTAHELGHSLGLPHAHSLEAGSEMLSTGGTTNEYGHPFDVMGRGGISGHFNVLYKWRIGWEDSAEIKEVKATGIYRLHAHDNGVHKGRLLGIRVPSGNTAYAYWFEYRSVSSSARNGAITLLQGFRSATNLDAWYLDATPASKTSSDESDGILTVGREFKDRYGETTFKTVAINSGIWNEDGWVDVQVTVPGSIPVMVARDNLLNPARDDRGPSFNLMGRAIDGISARQAVAVKAGIRKGVLALRAP